ncbi:MAG: transcription termination/antitermination protein NusG [Desulfatirhabdiaceae bacterium]
MKITERACPGQFPGKDDCSFIDYQNWYAIQTLSGCEKTGFNPPDPFKKIQLYLPTRKVIHQFKGVQHIMELPLFPGYIIK